MHPTNPPPHTRHHHPPAPAITTPQHPGWLTPCSTGLPRFLAGVRSLVLHLRLQPRGRPGADRHLDCPGPRHARCDVRGRPGTNNPPPPKKKTTSASSSRFSRSLDLHCAARRCALIDVRCTLGGRCCDQIGGSSELPNWGLRCVALLYICMSRAELCTFVSKIGAP